MVGCLTPTGDSAVRPATVFLTGTAGAPGRWDTDHVTSDAYGGSGGTSPADIEGALE